MKKIFISLIIAISLISPLAASSFDLSMSLGQENYKWWNNGISFSYGVNLGITKRMELNLWGVSQLIAKPFSSNMFGIDMSFALLGERSSGTKIAGSGINTLLSIGAFYKTEDNGIGAMVSVTPITVGNPITGRRERLFRTGIGWDFVNSSLVVSFSLMNLDYYIVGSYRDYEY